jgi:hypothetical protein
LSQLNPDIVIVHSVTAGSAMGDAVHAEYYQCLTGERCGYERVLSHGDLTVYGRLGQTEAMFKGVAAVPSADCQTTVQ